MATLVVTGTVSSASGGAVASTAGYGVGAALMARLRTGDAATDVVDVPVSASTRVRTDGAFTLTVASDGELLGPLTLTVSSPDGTTVAERALTLEQAKEPVKLAVVTVDRVTVTPTDDPTGGARVTLQGRVVDIGGRRIAVGTPIVLHAAKAGAAPGASPAPVLVTTTQADGRFSGPWPGDVCTAAQATLGGEAPVAIALDDAGRLPLFVLVVLALRAGPGDGADGDADCSCDDVPPRAPEPADLVANPAAFSQDLGGGCVDLTTPNRTVEEFSYRLVVRTTEPAVKALTIDAGRRRVPPTLLGDLLGVAVAAQRLDVRAPVTRRSSYAAELGSSALAMDLATARQLVRSDDVPSVEAVTRAAWLSQVQQAKTLISASLGGPGRRPLDADDPIDWDDTPTISQAVEIAHGHLLHFREVWRADGFSLGDLLYSLPLAPGQRRQIAVVDWERRTTSSRTEALEFEEHLEAFLDHDRDVSEIVHSNVRQHTRGGSSNTTWGVAGGLGAGFIGEGFGIFGGVAGGYGRSDSNAWMRSSRHFSADSLQQLRDRVTQRASAVRDQRSTVVQAVSQGETQRIETEVVANYNRCHAVTMEYFEVLRHFLVTHELASVSECVFVPLPMSPFDRAKVLRWREAIGRRLRDRSLRDGFAALRRIADNWVGWDYPEHRFSEEAPEVLEGELRISFVLPRPRDDDDGKFTADTWAWLAPYLSQDTRALWAAKLNELSARERDAEFRRTVAPEIAERLVQGLRFAYVTSAGEEIEVSLDPTLVSRYVGGVPLYVTLNPRGALPSVARERIAHLKVWSDADVPPDGRVILHSAKVRYRTPHLVHLLVDAPRVLDDLRAGDPAVIATPLSRAELRDPRQDDRDLADRLVAHTNEYLEHYHSAIWTSLDPQRRFMLLDSLLLPGPQQRSVASVCVNELIGIVGNSLVLPVAPGIRLDPNIDGEPQTDPDTGQPIPPAPLVDAYVTAPPPPMRVSVPTRGVYAEAVSGECSACEQIDDTRYWRWGKDGLLAPPEIAPVSTGTRAADDPDLTPTALPKPLVSIQTAPALPSTPGLADAFGFLATKDLFTDITGLEGTQKNAAAAFEASLTAASALGGEAAKLATQQELSRNASRITDRIAQAKADGLLSPETASELTRSALEGLIGEPRGAADATATGAAAAVDKVVSDAAQSSQADIKVASGDEVVEVSFDDDTPVVGAGGSVGTFDVPAAEEFVTQDVVIDAIGSGAPGARAWTIDRLADIAAFTAKFSAANYAARVSEGVLKDDPASVPAATAAVPNPKATRFLVRRQGRVVYPADPKDADKLAKGGKFPVVAILHGNHDWVIGGLLVGNHLGYGYLQDELAREGIVSISVDTNAANAVGSLIEMRAEMLLSGLDYLRAEHGKAKKDSRFSGRLDFTKVALVGHSRGGDAVIRAALLNKKRAAAKRFGISAVCAIAPTDYSGTSSTPHTLTASSGVFLAQLYGALDGDVSGGDGASAKTGSAFRHHDRAGVAKSLLFFDKACHNRFNDTWTADDAKLRAADIPTLLGRGDHRSLAIEYVLGLLRMQFDGKTTPRGLFDGRSANAAGARASLQWSFGRVKRLDEGEDAAKSLVGTRTLAGATVAPLALGPRTNHRTGVIAIGPVVPPPPPVIGPPALPPPPTVFYKLVLKGADRRWKGFDVLALRVCADADVTDAAKIAASALPDFSIVVIDGATPPKSATVTAATLTTPDRPTRPVLHLLKAGTNVTAVRLETLTVELSTLAIDLDDVAELHLVGPSAFANDQFFDSIQLVKR